MANHPSPYGSELVSTNCRHLAASKIPKERMEILSVRQWSGTARNKLVTSVQMHIRSLLHMLRFPRFGIPATPALPDTAAPAEQPTEGEAWGVM